MDKHAQLFRCNDCGGISPAFLWDAYTRTSHELKNFDKMTRLANCKLDGEHLFICPTCSMEIDSMHISLLVKPITNNTEARHLLKGG